MSATDTYSEDATIAVIESTAAAHEHSGRIEIKARRQMPQNLNVTFNLSLQMPAAQQPAPDVQQLIQQAIQQAQQALLQQAQQVVLDALKQQAPLAGVEAAFRDARWKRVP